ncbi:phosphodiester glycosidase family protein [Corticibacterium sp. UT-5YL-CI-8]|nr:phosphodiester glycosidase family protein [Tianweitania sp. UT-5YL-CI-8]
MNRRVLWLPLLAVMILAGGSSVFLWMTQSRKIAQADAQLPGPCRDLRFEAVDYIVCTIDLRRFDIQMSLNDEAGKPYRSLKRHDAVMVGKRRRPILSMNAGMYHEDVSAVGLLVEHGRETHRIELGDGDGNFFLKPNGVFSIGNDGTAAISESSAYAALPRNAAFATQSGPMLMIDGALHPRFEPYGVSRFIRNGVGVRDPNTVVLAISRQPVSFGGFARLFRDELGCRNALYFDGVVSAMTNGTDHLIGGGYPAGPILSVFEK